MEEKKDSRITGESRRLQTVWVYFALFKPLFVYRINFTNQCKGNGPARASRRGNCVYFGACSRLQPFCQKSAKGVG